MIALQILFIALAAVCWAYISLYRFGKLKEGNGFFEGNSWIRKYKYSPKLGLESAPDNLYYRTFGILYKERFPFSATALVFLTDAYHLAQWLMIKFILLAVTVNWVEFLILWFFWVLFFNASYVYGQKRNEKEIS